MSASFLRPLSLCFTRISPLRLSSSAPLPTASGPQQHTPLCTNKCSLSLSLCVTFVLSGVPRGATNVGFEGSGIARIKILLNRKDEFKQFVSDANEKFRKIIEERKAKKTS